MGATGWHYFVPYQSDVNQALQDLRNDVFSRKDYLSSITEADGLAAIEQLAAMSPNPEQARAQLQAVLTLARKWDSKRAHRDKQRGEPRTIAELLRQRAEEGTGTILDVDHISEQAEFGALHPLTAQQCNAFFGTERPTRAMVEQWRNRIVSLDEPPLYDRWEGIYLIVYAEEQPEAVYIEGCSGD